MELFVDKLDMCLNKIITVNRRKVTYVLVKKWNKIAVRQKREPRVGKMRAVIQRHVIVVTRLSLPQRNLNCSHRSDREASFECSCIS